MATTNGEAATKDPIDNATYQRLVKDVTAVKDDIAILTDQITDAINTFAGAAKKQARHGYKQARTSMDSALEEASERGSAMLDATQDAAVSLQETVEDIIAERPHATVGLALGLGFLIGMSMRR